MSVEIGDQLMTIPDVHCPFSGSGHCPANPPCPSNRERACTGFGEEDDVETIAPPVDGDAVDQGLGSDG
jgi:hypothetical protein